MVGTRSAIRVLTREPEIPWLRRQLFPRPSVRVYVSSDCRNDEHRIQFSAGTRTATESEIADLRYDRGARLPLEPWRTPTRREYDFLLPKVAPQSTGSSVAILTLPALSKEMRHLIANNDSDSIRENIVRPLTCKCDFGEPLHVIGIGHRPANLKTVTVNHRTGKFIGLHVDSWENGDLGQRDKAANRICVNIGDTDRYFLFLPFSLTEIASILPPEVDGGFRSLLPCNQFERLFMERYPDVPVIRCRLASGEAYIAPTENLIHDGSSEGAREVDRQFTVRGHIRLKQYR